MTTVAEKLALTHGAETTALECGFPIVEVSQVAEQESWRKEINRPLYHIHKWWATRLGSVFRAITLAALSEPGADTWKGFYERHRLTGKIVLDPFRACRFNWHRICVMALTTVAIDISPCFAFRRPCFGH